MESEQRYSEEELAAAFNRTTRTIRKWRQLGIVPPPHRIYREPYWTQEQFDKITKSLEVCGSFRKSAEAEAETK